MADRYYRYAVTGAWGDVPPAITAMVDEDESYLLYPEDRGEWSQQDLVRNGAIIGGWSLEARGHCFLDEGGEVVPESTTEHIDGGVTS